MNKLTRAKTSGKTDAVVPWPGSESNRIFETSVRQKQ
jgi:hypothetical protein